MQEYAGLLAASALQERDSAYLSIRAFTLPYSFLQGYLERDVEECWERIRSAILAGDDASVPGLVHEFKDKASSCRKYQELSLFGLWLTICSGHGQETQVLSWPRATEAP